jgi:hypothetical protein
MRDTSSMTRSEFAPMSEKVIVRSNLAAPQNGCAKGGKR